MSAMLLRRWYLVWLLVMSMQVYQLTVIQLTVVAEDRGPDAMPTDAAVVIRVVDVNDNAPNIVINTLSSRDSDSGGLGGETVAEVPENMPAGTFVAHVTVTDADSGEFGRVDCNLTDAAFSLLRRPDTAEFQVDSTKCFKSVATCISGVRRELATIQCVYQT